LAIIALGLALSTGAAASGENKRPVGTLVFSRAANERAPLDMFVMRANGANADRIAKDAAAPAPSPDGQRIAFVRGDDIWVMSRTGGAQRRLTTSPSIEDDPAWSADGKTIYFSRRLRVHSDWVYAVFRLRSDGRGVRQLTHPDRGECHVSPAPSPDGRIVAYAAVECSHGFQQTIVGVTMAGRPAAILSRLVTDFMRNSPAWSPDGKWLAFEQLDLDGQQSGLYVSAPDGSRLHRITPPRSWQTSPAWSPDGQWLAYVDDTDQLWSVRRDGTGARQLTTTIAKERDPAWLPTP
jgi:Tol biopolymer transport system component